MSAEQPAELSPNWSNVPTTFGTLRTSPVSPVDSAAALDALASPGADHVATAADILDRLAQAFGTAELPLLTDRGEVRAPFFTHSAVQARAWAEANGVPVSEATSYGESEE